MGGSNAFRVSPEHVQALSKELQSVVDDINDFLMSNTRLMPLPQQAKDPVSVAAVQAFSENAGKAISEAGKFAANLQQVVDSLNGATNAYQSNDQDGQFALESRS